LLAGAPVTVMKTISNNFVPVTCGNIIAGALVIGGGFSWQFGEARRGKVRFWGYKISFCFLDWCEHVRNPPSINFPRSTLDLSKLHVPFCTPECLYAAIH
jgi:hypothetical protein